MSKLAKKIELQTSTYAEVCEILGKERFHAENLEGGSSMTIDNQETFEYWKSGVVSRYPNARLAVTKGGFWFEEVRIEDDFFQASAKASSESRFAYLSGIGDSY
ncbi:MAG: hypothetical protein AAGB30_11220 [Pedobacter sp.]|nr:hypothetical protein [Pedobacter sp.]